MSKELTKSKVVISNIKYTTYFHPGPDKSEQVPSAEFSIDEIELSSETPPEFYSALATVFKNLLNHV